MLQGQEFEELRNSIRNIRNENYSRTIKKCLIYLSRIQKIKNQDVAEDKAFIYHNLGLASERLNKANEAIRYELITLNYANPETSCFYIYARWTLAICYEKIGNIEKALENYRECSRRYRALGEEKQRIDVIFNQARILKSIKAIEKIINIYENSILKTCFNDYCELNDTDVLKNMYIELMDLYIVEGRKDDFLKILYSVKNREIKKDLYKEFINKVA